jgi:hypothetical protein
MDPEAIAVGRQLEAEDARFTIHHGGFGLAHARTPWHPPPCPRASPTHDRAVANRGGPGPGRGGVKQTTFCMVHRKTMITMGSPYSVWIHADEIISCMVFTRRGVCV